MRDRTSSFTRIRDTWTLAVFSAMYSCRPISRFVAPGGDEGEHLALARREPERVLVLVGLVLRARGAVRPAVQPQARPGGQAVDLSGQPRRSQPLGDRQRGRRGRGRTLAVAAATSASAACQRACAAG